MSSMHQRRIPRDRRRGDQADPIGDRPETEAKFPSGVRVQVQSGHDRAWASGFEVFVAQPGGGYLLRRRSDRSVVPITFSEAEVRLDPIPLPAVGSPSLPLPAA
jgi:hypothetical protein